MLGSASVACSEYAIDRHPALESIIVHRTIMFQNVTKKEYFPFRVNPNVNSPIKKFFQIGFKLTVKVRTYSGKLFSTILWNEEKLRVLYSMWVCACSSFETKAMKAVPPKS